jgi:hypothetical protein
MSGTPAADDQTTPYQQPVKAVLASLGTDARHELSEAAKGIIRWTAKAKAARRP